MELGAHTELVGWFGIRSRVGESNDCCHRSSKKRGLLKSQRGSDLVAYSAPIPITKFAMIFKVLCIWTSHRMITGIMATDQSMRMFIPETTYVNITRLLGSMQVPRLGSHDADRG